MHSLSIGILYGTTHIVTTFLVPVQILGTCANDVKVGNLSPMKGSAWIAEHWALDSKIVAYRRIGNTLKVKGFSDL